MASTAEFVKKKKLHLKISAILNNRKSGTYYIEDETESNNIFSLVSWYFDKIQLEIFNSDKGHIYIPYIRKY